MGRVVAAATIIAVHGNFLKNIPSPKGEKSTPALRRRNAEGKRGGGGGRGREREFNKSRKEKDVRGEKGVQGEKEGEERGRRTVGGGNSGVHRPHWQQQWHPPSHPTDTTELLDKL